MPDVGDADVGLLRPGFVVVAMEEEAVGSDQGPPFFLSSLFDDGTSIIFSPVGDARMRRSSCHYGVANL